MKFLLTSIGSTSWAMTTRRAFLFSTNAVTWLMPYFTLMGFFPGASCLPSAFFSALAVRRAFFSAFVSGRILCNNLNNCVAERKMPHTWTIWQLMWPYTWIVPIDTWPSVTMGWNSIVFCLQKQSMLIILDSCFLLHCFLHKAYLINAIFWKPT